ncbi:class III extradiol dioxygenase subunit B-like domain-containing protein [Nocardiopsis potens]|uniref:class III extradiol dioxygenase subunit B-like domain-containing protein n=1 Tax=Nocardiopsis potens TaxID=1246458 RepID=UPI00034BE3FC|nr:class III extradiol dioxygenase subunit B-like domain-containing protein [Nocardiopsis potens]
MLIAAAVCPHPPLLVPEVARGAAAELDGVRKLCGAALSAVAEAGADLVAVVGAGERERAHGPDAGGDLAPFGAALRVGPGPVELPLALTVGRWLAERAGLRPDRYLEVPADAAPERCAAIGAELAASVPRLALVAMGDGSARRPPASPGRPDERAPAFDAEVAAALGGADTGALAAIDPARADELMAAGRPAWQVLAGAAAGAGLSGELLAHEAPYGVGYFVARWS